MLLPLRALKRLRLNGLKLTKEQLQEFFMRSGIVLEELFLDLVDGDKVTAVRHCKSLVGFGFGSLPRVDSRCCHPVESDFHPCQHFTSLNLFTLKHIISSQLVRINERLGHTYRRHPQAGSLELSSLARQIA